MSSTWVLSLKSTEPRANLRLSSGLKPVQPSRPSPLTLETAMRCTIGKMGACPPTTQGCPANGIRRSTDNGLWLRDWLHFEEPALTMTEIESDHGAVVLTGFTDRNTDAFTTNSVSVLADKVVVARLSESGSKGSTNVDYAWVKTCAPSNWKNASMPRCSWGMICHPAVLLSWLTPEPFAVSTSTSMVSKRSLLIMISRGTVIQRMIPDYLQLR